MSENEHALCAAVVLMKGEFTKVLRYGRQQMQFYIKLFYNFPCNVVTGKKGTNNISGITSSNTGRFSHFFQCYNLLEICNKTVIKFPTTP